MRRIDSSTSDARRNPVEHDLKGSLCELRRIVLSPQLGAQAPVLRAEPPILFRQLADLSGELTDLRTDFDKSGLERLDHPLRLLLVALFSQDHQPRDNAELDRVGDDLSGTPPREARSGRTDSYAGDRAKAREQRGAAGHPEPPGGEGSATEPRQASRGHRRAGQPGRTAESRADDRCRHPCRRDSESDPDRGRCGDPAPADLLSAELPQNSGELAGDSLEILGFQRWQVTDQLN